MQKTTCPVCDGRVYVEDKALAVGEIVECPDCGATLEIVSLTPLKVEEIEPEEDLEEEDWY